MSILQAEILVLASYAKSTTGERNGHPLNRMREHDGGGPNGKSDEICDRMSAYEGVSDEIIDFPR